MSVIERCPLYGGSAVELKFTRLVSSYRLKNFLDRFIKEQLRLWVWIYSKVVPISYFYWYISKNFFKIWCGESAKFSKLINNDFINSWFFMFLIVFLFFLFTDKTHQECTRNKGKTSSIKDFENYSEIVWLKNSSQSL